MNKDNPYDNLNLYYRTRDSITYLIYTIGRLAWYTTLSLRVKQWYKNLLLFAALTFSGNMNNLSMWKTTILAFICFCILSSIGYIVNDIKDKQLDQTDQYRKERPIARNRIHINESIIIVTILAIATLTGCWFINLKFFIISLIYLTTTLSYTFIFKNIILVDILILALGFVIRVIAGSFAIELQVSEWMIICAFLLALFLGLNKRWYKAENLSLYSRGLLDKLISITTASLLAAYFIYIIQNHSYALLASAIFIVYALFRYIYLVQHLNHKAESENILSDKPILASIVCWIICVAMITIWR